MSVSVIIPVGPGEAEWKPLVASLALQDPSEILLSIGRDGVIHQDEVCEFPNVKLVREGQKRSGQMNAAALNAKHEWLWFLHADSRLCENTLEKMRMVMSKDKLALYYFDLKFRDDGPRQMILNERSVKFRSDVLKIPFGDQGFLIRRETFFDLGMYREDVNFGEDHVLVWKCHQSGIAVLPVGAGLLTSARKYQEKGWGKTTLKHVMLTFQQATPEFFKLVGSKLGWKIR